MSASTPDARTEAGAAGPGDGRVAAMLGLLAALIYLPSVANGFAFDDVPAILGDPRVLGVWNPARLLVEPYWAGSGSELGLYRPLLKLGFAFDWWVSGGAAWWFHLVNVAWHAAATALVFLLLRRLFERAPAAIATVLFAVHPVHVEAVANVVGRADVMAATFALGALLLWSARRSVVAVAGLYLAALACKESAVVLPLLLPLLDQAAGPDRPGEAGLRGYARARGAGYLALGVALGVYLGARHAAIGAFAPAMLHPAAAVLHSTSDRLATAFQVWPQYARLLFFPRTLLADYSPRILMPLTGWSAAPLAGVLLLAALLAAGAWAFSTGRARAGLALLWFPITIATVSNLLVPIGTLLAERTLYLPSLALSVAAALLWPWLSRAARPLAVTLALLVAIAMTGRTLARQPEWRSTQSIFAALERDRPDSYRVPWFRARQAAAAGQTELAAERYAAALELWPYRKALLIEAARLDVSLGRLRSARDIARFTLDFRPDDLDAHRLLVGVDLDLGDTAAARVHLRDALAVAPDDSVLKAMAEAVR